jgi:hypothetical protein
MSVESTVLFLLIQVTISSLMVLLALWAIHDELRKLNATTCVKRKPEEAVVRDVSRWPSPMPQNCASPAPIPDEFKLIGSKLREEKEQP